MAKLHFPPTPPKPNPSFFLATILGLVVFLLPAAFRAPADQIRTGQATVVAPALAMSRLPDPIDPCERNYDFFTCRVRDELIQIHQYLLDRKNDSGYTPDTRTLGAPTEVVRLLVDTQAHGYLNLYKLTHDPVYLTEAEGRLNYILSLGTAAKSFTAFDGMLGHTFYVAYELTGNPAYYAFADQIARECLTYSNNRMNWGMMCGMAFTKAYDFTGEAAFRNASRAVIQATIPYQFRDGSYPHVVTGPSDTHYSSWMAHEFLEIRASDPADPLIENSFIRETDFFHRRINGDGSLNYQDLYGKYYEIASGHEQRGWMEELAEMGFILRANGDTASAQRVLEYLFSVQNQNLGYPDKWGYFTPSDPWASSPDSAIRSSLVFWDLSLAALAGNQACVSGDTQACSDVPQGKKYCIHGTPTRCLNVVLVEYRYEPNCVGPYSRSVPPNCTQMCSIPGYRHCLGASCSQCMSQLPEVCGPAQCPGYYSGNPSPSRLTKPKLQSTF